MSTEGEDDLRSTFTRHESKPPATVPNQKKPKSRPPAGVREKIFRSPLPFYSGPYSVGFMDIEFPVRSPRRFSNIKRNHKHVLELETVLLSIYYPSGFQTGLGKSPDGAKKWSRATWLPRPRLELAKGYAKFAGVPEWVLMSYFAATTMFTKLPAYRNATLAAHWPANENAREGGWKVKNKAGPVPEGESEKPTFPLLCFSHGLGGTRTTYSSVCGEFASYGFIVMAIEHRDGSGPRTFINLPEGRRQAPAEHDLPDGEGKESTEGRTRGYDTIDYLFPKHNKYDTAPGNEVRKSV
jgi:platelet-activating factor acetylhydrolase